MLKDHMWYVSSPKAVRAKEFKAMIFFWMCYTFSFLFDDLRDLTEILYMANYHKHHFTCFVNFVLNSLETIIN
jgi:hypothetical protein